MNLLETKTLCLSDIFNFYKEAILRELIRGFIIGGHIIKAVSAIYLMLLRYAADSAESRQAMKTKRNLAEGSKRKKEEMVKL